MLYLLYYAIAFVLAVLLAFFGVFVSLFADGDATERFIAQVVIVLIYGVLGLAFGYLRPDVSWKWGILLSAPAILVVAFILFAEVSTGLSAITQPRVLLEFLYLLVYISAIVGTACLGSYASARRRGWGSPR